MSTFQDVNELLARVSQKKHMVSQESLDAKKEQERKLGDYEKYRVMQEEFNKSVSLLTAVFNRSRFDECIGLISRPTTLLCLNFLLGVIRGVGFGVGAVAVLWLFILLYQDLVIKWVSMALPVLATLIGQ